MGFDLIESLTIKNAEIDLKRKLCFLYQFKRAGFSKEKFTNWFNGRTMDVYEYTGRFMPAKKCPWCGNLFRLAPRDRIEHLREHGKKEFDIETIKLSQKAYPLLLQEIRGGYYDALLFLMRRDCQYCITPNAEGRKGKCSIPMSARDKPRSIKLLGLIFDGFDISKYSDKSIAIVYKA